MAKKNGKKDKPLPSLAFRYKVVEELRAQRIKEERADLRRKARTFIKVESYDRAKGAYLSDPSRKAVLFRKVETVCRVADITGVSAEDRKHAERAIALLTDTFIHRS